MTFKNDVRRVVTRLLVRNFGGFENEIVHFDTNGATLIFGRTGTGKTTLADALNILLFGTTDKRSFNRAKHDGIKGAERRSLEEYIRGCTQDDEPIRNGQDVCALLVLETKLTDSDKYYCMGCVFQLGANDDRAKYNFFTHDGKIPMHEYQYEDRDYIIEDFRNYMKSLGSGGAFYETNELYISRIKTIRGTLDLKRAEHIQALSLSTRMEHGVNQFLQETLYDPDTDIGANVTTLISEMSDYQRIKRTVAEQNEKKRKLKIVCEAMDERDEADQLKKEADSAIHYAEYIENEENLNNAKLSLKQSQDAKQELEDKQHETDEKRNQALEKAQDIAVELRSNGDIDNLQKLLLASKSHAKSLEDDITREKNRRFDGVVRQIRKDAVYGCNITHGEGDILLTKLIDRSITEEEFNRLRSVSDSVYEDIKNKSGLFNNQIFECKRILGDLNKKIENAEHGRKTYIEGLVEFRDKLVTHLQTSYPGVKIEILADTFNINDETWRKAMEGWLAINRYALVVPPNCFREAYQFFKTYNTENAHRYKLLNIGKMSARCAVQPHSLFDCVTDITSEYAAIALKYYLGNVIRCETFEEMERSESGVTADCMSNTSCSIGKLNPRWCNEHVIGTTVSVEELEADKKERDNYKGRIEEIENEVKNADIFLKLLDRLDKNWTDVVAYYNNCQALDEQNKETERYACKIEEITSSDRYQTLIAERNKITSELEALNKEAEDIRKQLDTARSDVNKFQMILEQCETDHNKLATYAIVSEKVRAMLNAHVTAGKKIVSFRNDQAARSTKLGEDLARFADAVLNAKSDYITHWSDGVLDFSQESEKHFRSAFIEASKFAEEQEKILNDKVIRCKHAVYTNAFWGLHNSIRNIKEEIRRENIELRKDPFGDNYYQIAVNETDDPAFKRFYKMLISDKLNELPKLSDDAVDGQMDIFRSEFEEEFYDLQNDFIEQLIPTDETSLETFKASAQKMLDYRSYIHFEFELCKMENGTLKRLNSVDKIANKTSGGESMNPKYVALIMSHAMLYRHTGSLNPMPFAMYDEAFQQMDSTRSKACVEFANRKNLQTVYFMPEKEATTLLQAGIFGVVNCVQKDRYTNIAHVLHVSDNHTEHQVTSDKE